jgi:hypothetical protein
MKRFAKFNLRLRVGLALIAACVACNKNVLEKLSNKGTDDALYYAAQQQLNSRDFTGAISTISTLSASYRGQRSVQFLLASAYAGRCGLEFIPLANALTTMTSGTTLMDVLLTQLAPVAQTSDCQTAEATLRALSPSNSGVFTDPNEALQMATIAMAKVGSILAIATGTHAGALNSSFDPCHVTAASTDTSGLSPADVDQIGTGLTLAYNNLQVNPSFATAISAMGSACLTAKGPPISDDVCSKTTPGFNATELLAIRNLVDYQSVGIGTNATLYGCGP